MKGARRRIDVSLEELDRVLDGARPITANSKAALHALAAMLVRDAIVARLLAYRHRGLCRGPFCKLANGSGPLRIRLRRAYSDRKRRGPIQDKLPFLGRRLSNQKNSSIFRPQNVAYLNSGY